MSNKYKKYKNFLEKFLDSNFGKRLFNIIYSVGAAVVIIGAMAKILHWSFGDEMLMIGMITEAVVFLLSAFEKPSKDYKWEEVYPVLADDDNFVPKSERITQTVQPQQMDNSNSGPAIQSTSIPSSNASNVSNASNERSNISYSNNPPQQTVASNIGGSSGSGSGTVIIGGGDSVRSNTSSKENPSVGGNIAANSGGSLSGNITIVGGSSGGGTANISGDGVEQLSQMADNMDKFAKATEALTQISESLQKSFSTIIENSDGIGNNTQNYINQMEALNRNISGLNTIYEIQLKGVSGQINTIEHINAGLDRIKKLYDGSLADSSIFKNETEKMAKQLSELNLVYSRLLQAMTTNMNLGGGFTPPNMGDNPSQL